MGSFGRNFIIDVYKRQAEGYVIVFSAVAIEHVLVVVVSFERGDEEPEPIGFLVEAARFGGDPLVAVFDERLLSGRYFEDVYKRQLSLYSGLP